MQKKLIALAVAGLASTAAFAQSNVTIYGVVDTYAGRFSGDGANTQTAVNSGGLAGSRLGFKGVEDLGNGLKALFVLEYSIASDDTTGPTSARQQMVGVTGGFGTAVAGRLQTAGYDFSADTNALHGTAINPEQSVTTSALITSSSRANNAIAYISPNFSGFTVALNHARVTEARFGDTKETDATATLGSVKYANGPLNVNAIYDEVVDAGQATQTHVKEWGIGAGYDFGVASIKGNYLSTKTDVGAADYTDKTWTLSGAVPVTSTGTVVLGYARNSYDSDRGDDLNSSSWTVAYLHSLSKRTTLYTGYQRVSNEDNVGVAVAGLSGLENGGSSSAFVAGINHKF